MYIATDVPCMDGFRTVRHYFPLHSNCLPKKSPSSNIYTNCAGLPLYVSAILPNTTVAQQSPKLLSSTLRHLLFFDDVGFACSGHHNYQCISWTIHGWQKHSGHSGKWGTSGKCTSVSSCLSVGSGVSGASFLCSSRLLSQSHSL